MMFGRLIVIFLAVTAAQADTRTASSVDRADVIVALALCSSGDTLAIPAGTASWTTTVVVDFPLTIQGAGIGQTIITDNIDKLNVSADAYAGRNTSEAECMFVLDTALGEAFTISGIETNAGARVANYTEGQISLLGRSKSVLITGCRIETTKNRGVYVRGGVQGVLASSELDSPVGIQKVALFNGLYNWGVGEPFYGDGPWEVDQNHGDGQAWFIEDCTVTGEGSLTDGFGGAVYVVRYNDFTGRTKVGNHGTESTGRYRGTRRMDIYNNTFHGGAGSNDRVIDFRSGSGVIHDNVIDVGAGYSYFCWLNCYRAGSTFAPWGMADGTNDFDINDLTDGAGTPGGAGDGVFYSGTSTSGGTNTLADTGQSWTNDQLNGYSLRCTIPITATAGSGLRSVVVSGAGWTTNTWASWQATQISTGLKSTITSNTSDTLTLNSNDYPITAASTESWVISGGGQIYDVNAGTQTLTVLAGEKSGGWNLSSGLAYEIRRVEAFLDAPGRGTSADLVATDVFRPSHQDVSQGVDPIYAWNNTYQGSSTPTITVGAYGESTGFGIVVNRDYYNNTAKPGYFPYTYPHPLRGVNKRPRTPGKARKVALLR